MIFVAGFTYANVLLQGNIKCRNTEEPYKKNKMVVVNLTVRQHCTPQAQHFNLL